MAQLPRSSPRSPPATDLAGKARLVGARFRITHLVAETLGTETFLGIDHQSGADVVVKTVPLASLSPGALMRLEHEAARLRRVESRHFARLLDAGRETDHFFLVLEYIPGVPLRKRLEASPLGTGETIAVGRALFSALRDIHHQGVLHRGVRPSNIIVNEEARSPRPPWWTSAPRGRFNPKWPCAGRNSRRPSTSRRSKPARWTTTWPSLRTSIRPARSSTIALPAGLR